MRNRTRGSSRDRRAPTSTNYEIANVRERMTALVEHIDAVSLNDVIVVTRSSSP